MTHYTRDAGFTLIELVVVALIIGILAAFAVPQYLRSVEETKASDAAAMARMIGITNRMFYGDHGSTYVSGQLTTAGTGCKATDACPTSGPYSGCALVACKYVAGQDWDPKPYIISALDASNTVSLCGAQTIPSGKYVACAVRKNSTNCPGCSGSTNLSPYSGWGYTFDANGAFGIIGAAPTPVP